MKAKWQKIGQHLDVLWWVVVIVGGLIIPMLKKQPLIHFGHMKKAFFVGWLLFTLNGFASLWLGYRLAQRAGHWWKLFVMPIVFFITAYHFAPKYTWYFALFYLGVSYLTWSIKRSSLNLSKGGQQ